MSSGTWTPKHPGYVDERKIHDLDCDEKPSTCNCSNANEFWVISDEEMPIVDDKVGKWMLFPTDEKKFDEIWSIVSDATRQGLLGWGAKYSFKDKKRPAILVYTCDSTNESDINRVLETLKSLFLTKKIVFDGYRYKTDEATHQNKYSKQDILNRPSTGHIVSQNHDLQKPCLFYKNGYCKHGDKCIFKHI